jgi:hypothetical protein
LKTVFHWVEQDESLKIEHEVNKISMI